MSSRRPQIGTAFNLHSRQTFVAIITFLLALALAAISSVSRAEPNSFQQLDNFETLEMREIDEQNGWTGDANAVIIVDPDRPGNKVLRLNGHQTDAFKPLLQAGHNDDDGDNEDEDNIDDEVVEGDMTLFFRLRRQGMTDIQAGLTDDPAPSEWTDFEVQFGSRESRLGEFSIFDGPDRNFGYIDGFEEETWYCVWLLTNQEDETVSAYVRGGIYADQTRFVDGDGQMTFNYRNGHTEGLSTFMARTGSRNGNSMWFDDIYIDLTGANLSQPVEGCQGTDEPIQTTLTPSPTASPSPSPSSSPTPTPTPSASPSPTPEPTNTSEPPTQTATQTPEPTGTPAPTETPVPASSTPEPAASATPIPSATAQPTQPSQPTATQTATPFVPTETPFPTATPLPDHCAGLVQEAEDGLIFPDGDMIIGESAEASGGAFVWAPDVGNFYAANSSITTRVEFCVIAPIPGFYKIAALALAESGKSNSFYVRVNQDPDGLSLEEERWDLQVENPEPGVPGPFTKQFVRYFEAEEDLTVELMFGANNITFRAREDGAKLDRIEVELVGVDSSFLMQSTFMPFIAQE
ncbi:MAG: hypothetical protein AAF633_04700 [Chloroflexota bacterium]